MGFEKCEYCSCVGRRSIMNFCVDCWQYTCESCHCSCYTFQQCEMCKEDLTRNEYNNLPSKNRNTCRARYCHNNLTFCVKCTAKIFPFCNNCVEDL